VSIIHPFDTFSSEGSSCRHQTNEADHSRNDASGNIKTWNTHGRFALIFTVFFLLNSFCLFSLSEDGEKLNFFDNFLTEKWNYVLL